MFVKDVLLLFVLLLAAELTCSTNVMLFTMQSKQAQTESERDLSQRQRSLSFTSKPPLSRSLSL